MKLTARWMAAALLISSGAASANIDCNDTDDCNILWESDSNGIILGSICQDYRYKPEYKSCKKAAKEILTSRCDIATRHQNPLHKKHYCTAARNFKP